MLRRRLMLGLGSVLVVFGAGALVAPNALADSDIYTPISVDVRGTTHIGSGVNANAALGPATMTAQFGVIYGGIQDGVLPLPATSVQFNALGVVPVRATVSFIGAAPITGSLVSADVNTVSVNASYYVKLSNVQAKALVGWVPLFVGNDCRTAQPVQLHLQTPAGQSYDLNTGGTITGKYTIGQFQNCAPLRLPDLFGVGSVPVNALIPGSNNTISLDLTNFQFLPTS